MALLIIIGTILMAASLSLLVKKKSELLGWITMVASIIELLATLFVASQVLKNGAYALNSYLSVDYLGIIVMLIVAVIGLAASWYSISYLKVEMAHDVIGFRRVKQFFVLLHLFILAMFFAIMTTNPILMWISIEATTLSTAFLISFYGKPSAIEAAWKYLIINSVGLLIGFLGTLLFFHPAIGSPHNGLLTWGWMTDNVSKFDPSVIRLAFIFVLVGYGTKVGLVPMHTWLPDAHSKAPVPISSLLSGVLLNVAFLAVLRFKVITDLVVGSAYSQELLIFFGLASILVSAFIIFTQKNYKRLLAYHSIEHMGIITLGFGFGGIASFAALLHLIYHALAKSALFLLAGNILLKYGSTKMKNVKGIIKTLPITSVLFFIGFLVLAGIPPFGIFITEFSILLTGIQISLIITIIVLFSLAFVAAGIIRHISEMIFGESEQSILDGEAGINTIFPAAILIAILIFISFFIPTEMQSLLHSATLNY